MCMGFCRALRARSGHRADDDRKPSHRADLAVDARMPVHQERLAQCRISRWLASSTARRWSKLMSLLNNVSITPPQHADERERLADVHPATWLSLIHISEPTRRTPISYAVFCLK